MGNESLNNLIDPALSRRAENLIPSLDTFLINQLDHRRFANSQKGQVVPLMNAYSTGYGVLNEKGEIVATAGHPKGVQVPITNDDQLKYVQKHTSRVVRKQ